MRRVAGKSGMEKRVIAQPDDAFAWKRHMPTSNRAIWSMRVSKWQMKSAVVQIGCKTVSQVLNPP